MSVAALKDALKTAKLIHDRAAILKAIDKMAIDIHKDYSQDDDEHPPLYITIMNGGMLFASDLALALGQLGLYLEFDYLHATRYRGSQTGSGLAWLHRPATSMRDRRVILIDDILDEGQTLKAVKRWCEDQFVKDVKIAVLAVKKHDRCVEDICADYTGLEVPDRYVFGYGMDFNEQGRNLPVIYALNE